MTVFTFTRAKCPSFIIYKKKPYLVLETMEKKIMLLIFIFIDAGYRNQDSSDDNQNSEIILIGIIKWL